VKPEVLKSLTLEMDYSRAPCLGTDQMTRGLWERVNQGQENGIQNSDEESVGCGILVKREWECRIGSPPSRLSKKCYRL